MPMTCQQFKPSPNLFGDGEAYGIWPTKSEQDQPAQLGYSPWPQTKGFSQRVAKVLRGFNIKVAHKPILSVFSPSQTIYLKIKCTDCGCVYVGQTCIRHAKNMYKKPKRIYPHWIKTLCWPNAIYASQSPNRFGLAGKEHYKQTRSATSTKHLQ